MFIYCICFIFVHLDVVHTNKMSFQFNLNWDKIYTILVLKCFYSHFDSSTFVLITNVCAIFVYINIGLSILLMQTKTSHSHIDLGINNLVYSILVYIKILIYI